MRFLIALGGLGVRGVLEVASACCSRLSDECQYETATVQNLVLRLGRSRHRAEVGICEQVKEVPGLKK